MLLIAFISLAVLISMTFYKAFRGKIHTLSLILLAGAVFAFLYVIQPAYTLTTGAIYHFLDDWQIFKGIVVPAIMYIFLLWGWFSGMKKTGRTNKAAPDMLWNYRRLYIVGFLLAAVGSFIFSFFIQSSGGINVFYGAPHATGGAWQEQTAYIYFAEYLVYPGLVLMILTCVRRKGSAIRWFPILLFSLLMLMHSILIASRGVFFSLVVSVGLSYYLSKKKMPNVRTVIIGGIIVGLIVLLLVGYRDLLYLGEPASTYQRTTFNEALFSTVELNESSIMNGYTGNEFIFSAAIIDTLDKLQKYHLGINWIYRVTAHMIPRILWPDKPYAWDSPGIDGADIFSEVGYKVSLGAAPGIVGDLYLQFGLAAVFFFFLLGWVSAYLFKKVRVSDDPRVITAYTIWYAWGLHLFAQGFGAVIVPYIYIMVPTLLLMNFARSRLRYSQFSPRGTTVAPTGEKMLDQRERWPK